MPRSKYETHVEPYLDKIEEWVRKGASQDEIAKKLQITKSTLALYLKKGREGKEPYSVLSDCFAQACEEPDDNVEAALYKSAIGYNVTVMKAFKVKVVEVDPVSGKKIREYEKIVQSPDEVHVPASTDAQKFWLANRRKSVWSYKPEGPGKEDGEEDRGVIMMPTVAPKKEEKA